jgi:signal peptidase II
MFSNTKKMALLYIVAIFFIFLDRFAKIYFTNTRDEVKLLGSYLSLNYAENPYIAFSIPISPILIKFLSLSLGMLIIVYFLKYLKEKKQIIIFPLFLLILGSFSNIYDRFMYGYVIDYIDLRYFTIFNIADSMIFISVLFLSYFIYKKEGNTNK